MYLFWTEQQSCSSTLGLVKTFQVCISFCNLQGKGYIYPLPGKLQSGDTDLERFLVYLCIGVKLLILDTLSTYTYEIDLKNLHLNTPFLLVLNNSMRGGVNNFMPFRKQRLSKCCIFGDIFSKYMNLSIFVLRLI